MPDGLNGSVPVWDASIFRFIRIIGRITGGRKDYMEQMDYRDCSENRAIFIFMKED